jgi:hypothetical protein
MMVSRRDEQVEPVFPYYPRTSALSMSCVRIRFFLAHIESLSTAGLGHSPWNERQRSFRKLYPQTVPSQHCPEGYYRDTRVDSEHSHRGTESSLYFGSHKG